MTINMPCVGCVDFNLKRPWVISCDISSEQRSMHIYRTITEWGEQQSELGFVPANERWACERRSIRFLPQRKEAKGNFKRHLRTNDANDVYKKEKKKTFAEVITLFFHGINILRSLMQTAVVLWEFHEPVANGISCLNIDGLLVVKTLFKDIGHFRASQTWAYYFEVQVYFIPFIVGVKLISCRIFHFSLSVEDKPRPNVLYFERLVIW